VLLMATIYFFRTIFFSYISTYFKTFIFLLESLLTLESFLGGWFVIFHYIAVNVWFNLYNI